MMNLGHPGNDVVVMSSRYWGPSPPAVCAVHGVAKIVKRPLYLYLIIFIPSKRMMTESKAKADLYAVLLQLASDDVPNSIRLRAP